MNSWTYKGYFARIEFDPEDEIFEGQLAEVLQRSAPEPGTTVKMIAAVNDITAMMHHMMHLRRRPARSKYLLEYGN